MPSLEPMDHRLTQRVGERDRAAVCDELSDQYAVGRLTADELDRRLTAVIGARTRGDLAAPLADLPPLAGSAPAVNSASDRRSPVPPSAGAGVVLDVVAVLALLGSTGLALLFLIMIGTSYLNGLNLLIAVIGGSVAAVGGAAVTHLVHRGVDRANRNHRSN